MVEGICRHLWLHVTDEEEDGFPAWLSSLLSRLWKSLCSSVWALILLLFQVLLRVKESEIQYLKQEISSLKDELQTALRVMAPLRGRRD